jgi:hypothetical protein
MVSLPGDVAPERFMGFYGQTAPQRALMKRQYGDIPPQNFLQRQSGLLAGIPHAISKLKNINGFMDSTTNYVGVQNAPAYLQMRKAAVARRDRDRAQADSEEFKTAVKAAALQQSLLRAEKKRRLENAPKVYRSKAAGLKLKQALREVTVKGIPLMQRETTRSAVRRLYDKKGRYSDKVELRDLLRRLAGEPQADDIGDLAALAEADRRRNPTRALDTSLADANTSNAAVANNSSRPLIPERSLLD